MKWFKSRAFKVLAGCAISAFFVWFSLRNTDLKSVWGALREAHYLFVLPYLACLVAIHFLRVVRWGILLEPAGKPSFTRLNRAGAIGFMALVVMPFRLGEFARPLLIAEKGRIRPSAAMASVVVERIVDGLAMAVVLIVALLFSHPVATPAEMARIRWGGAGVFAAFFGLLVFLVLAYWKREHSVRLVGRILRPLSPALAHRASEMLDAFILALKVLPSWRKTLWFWLETIAYWGINATGLAILARGFGLPLDLSASFAVLGILIAGVMIPAGPGMLGTFQWAIVFGMGLFFPGEGYRGQITAYAWMVWACQFSQQVLFGLYYVVRGHDASWSVAMGGEAAPEPLSEERRLEEGS